jgi:hypothetical protein
MAASNLTSIRSKVKGLELWKRLIGQSNIVESAINGERDM